MRKEIQKRHPGMTTAAALTLLTFVTSQTVFSAELPASELLSRETVNPAVTASEVHPGNAVPENIPVDPTFQFLQTDRVLEPVFQETSEAVLDEETAELENQNSAEAPGSFDSAFDFLNQAKGFAVTAVDKISGSDLVKLARQAWEYGIAVVKGIVLLFTSHEAHGLSVTQTFRAILDTASDFLMHKQSYGEKDPSGTDFTGASVRGGTEYIVSLENAAAENLDVTAFNGSGESQSVDFNSVDVVMHGLADSSYAAYQDVLKLIEKENTKDRSLLEFYRSDPPVEINPAEGNPDLVLLPATKPGSYPVLKSYVPSKTPTGETEYSSVDITVNSGTHAEVVYHLYNQTTYGWAGVEYDDLYTPQVQESLNFSGHYADGLTLSLSSPDLTEVIFEVTDVNGQKSRVILKGITSTAQKWTILPENFSDVDLTQIAKVAIGLEGRYPDSHLGIDWGRFNYAPAVSADPSNPALTTLPATSQGQGPQLRFESSKVNSDASYDYSDASFEQVSSSQFSGSVNLYNKTSWGRVYWSYDNYGTESIETLDLTSAFSDGIVFSLKSADLQEIFFEVRDNRGRIARVQLSGITPSSPVYKVLLSDLQGIDLTQITDLGFESEGKNVGKTFEAQWPGLAYTPSSGPDASNPAITPLPPDGSGKPVFSVSSTKLDSNGNTDWSDAALELQSLASAQFRFNLYNRTSEGRAEAVYKSPVDLESVFPAGIVFALTDNGTGLDGVYFEATDADGKKDQVFLSGLTASAQTYKILLNQLDSIDLSRVVSLAFVSKGVHVGQSLGLDWGGFAGITEVAGGAYQEAQLTLLADSPALIASGSNVNASQPAGQISLEQDSSSEFSFVYDRTVSESSSVSAAVSGGSFDNNLIFNGTPISLPEQFILAARGTEDGRLRVTVTDTSLRQAFFILKLRPVYQNYVLELTGDNIPESFDRTKIASIIFTEDQKTGDPLLNNVIKVQIPGLHYDPPQYSEAENQVRDMLITKGLTYFSTDKGLDPATHLPYDSIEADGHPKIDEVDIGNDARFTQPTLIGYYLQILGEVVGGTLDNGMTRDEALTEIDTVLTSLLTIQEDFGWKGMIPWMRLGPELTPYTPDIALGDNANLAQSLAGTSGTLSTVSLTPEQTSAVAAIQTKIELFLDNQAEGYASFVDEVSGSFFQVFTRDSLTSQTGHFPNFYMDRLANEFRGGIAFLQVRYDLPSTVWEALGVHYNNYTTSQGETIQNLAYFDGGAFQAFWPLLHTRETDFIGFHNALENAFISYADFSASHNLPGFVSASQRPDDGIVSGVYESRQGVREIAEGGSSHADQFVSDVGSTYALAAAFSLDPQTVLAWLASIREQLPGLEGNEGFFDGARSDTEIAKRTLGVDAASMILGLSNVSSSGFETYLRNHGLELDYNLLYDGVSRSLSIAMTNQEAAAPPVIPDRSLAVFSHIDSQGTINNFNQSAATPAGIHPVYGSLAANGGYGGYFWFLDQSYDARSNKLLINYTASDTPQQIKLELKDEFGQTVGVYTPSLVDTASDKIIEIDLPNTAEFSTITQVVLVIDQNATNDTSGNFIIHSIDFQYYAS